MTEPTPPSRDPFEGIDPETWAILAAQQSGASPAADPRDGAAGGAGASAGSAAWGPDPAGGQASVGRGAGAGGWPVSAGPAAWAATITTAVVLVVAALVDPSGLAAPIAWSGADVVPSLPWTWLQYALQGPLIVLLVWLGTRRLLRAATPAAPRRWVLSRTWLLVVLALMVAKLGYGLAWMAPFLLGGGDEGLPPDTSVPYLAWATGFVAVKGLLIGWVPALAAALAWRAGQARRAGAASVTIEPSLALAPAGLVVLALVPLGPWLTQHWWTGSPIGYAHASDWRLLAPTTAGGALSQVAALLIVWLLLASSIRATLRRVATPRPAAALRLAGSLAGVVAGLGLAVVQSVLALAAGTDLAGGDDLWIVPSTYLRLIEGLSFGLLLAPLAAIATWLVPRAPRPRWTLGGVLVGVLAVGVAIMLVVRAGEREVAPVPLAATDTPPVALPAAAAVLTPSASGPPRRLTVRRDADGTAVLADQAGAQVTLRGINVNQLGDYYAANPAVAPVQPLTEQDFADIAAMGMNAVRLVLSWSLLEPTAGQVDDGYLAEVRRAVRWAGASGIHVVLDLHQDAWGKEVVAPAGTTCRAGTSPMTGWDGAPAWATAMDDAPPCQFTGRDLAPNVLRAFTSFSTDRDAAQARLLAVWQRLAREFGGDPTVAGYDLLNEPSFAEQAPMTSGMLLGRYHALAIRAIRAGEQQAAGGYAHPIFLEPSIWWSGFGVDPLPPRGFTDDPQVVFAPHLYNESITMDQSLGQTFVGIERGFALAARAARGWGSPLWIGEWGSFREPEANRAYYDRFLAAADRRRVGGAVWVWKQGCGDPHVYPSTEAGNIRRIACPSGAPLPSRPAELAPLQRAYPRSVPGRLTELRSDGRTLVLAGDTTGAGPVAGGAPSACTLDVWVPGTAEPRVGASVGVSRLRVVSVPEGSPQQAPSGGWRLVGCATGTYQLRLS